MDSDAGQVDTWVTLAEAASILSRSEKTLRRWITSGDLDKEAVRREETTGGFRYMLRRADVEKLVGAKGQRSAHRPDLVKFFDEVTGHGRRARSDAPDAAQRRRLRRCR